MFVSREIVPLLRRHGIATWFSDEDIRTAAEWERSIRTALEECDWFLIALSPRALESPWVRTEVHWAVEKRPGRIIPILLDNCNPSELHLKLPQIQYVDFRTASHTARRKLLELWDVTYDPLPSAEKEDAQRVREFVASLPGHSLIKTLGRGSTATVFLVRSELRGLVAMKVLDPALGGVSPDFVTAAVEAVRNMARVHHPSVISILDVSEVDDLVYITMEYASGPTLADVLKLGNLPVRRAMELLADISDGLGAAHRCGVFHRDLKPQNIFLDGMDQPHIGDFGLKPQGLSIGTLSYALSPESTRAEESDARSDVWAVGVMMYELLTGTRPFQYRGGISELVHDIQRLDPPLPCTIVPAVPAELERICLKCLAKRPENRYASGDELSRDLRRWLAL